MDIVGGLMQGFVVALQPANLLWCFIGVLLGTVVGIMPGLGPPATIAMLLPITALMNPAGAMIMLAGIYYGAKYGGSTTSILLNVPGESASVVTCLDGYAMARKGRAGPALGIAAIASFIAGTVGVLGLMLVAPPLARFALAFSAPEYFALMAFGLSMVVLLAGRSMAKALLAMLVGLWIAGVGTDPFSTTSRFTFGQMELLSGIDFVVVAIGIFAIGEVLANLEAREEPQLLPVPKGLRNLLPTIAGPARLPLRLRAGLGHRLSRRRAAGRRLDHCLVHLLRRRESLLAAPRGVRYRRDRRCGGTRRGQQFRDRRRAGAAAHPWHSGLGHDRDPPRGAGALGLQARAALHRREPEPVLGLVASMYIGNVMLLILNLPLVPVFAQVLRTPVYVLYPLILGVSIVGSTPARAAFSTWRCSRLRPARLPDAQARLSHGAADPRAGARWRDGARAAPVADDVGGQPVDPCFAADLGRDAMFCAADFADSAFLAFQFVAPARTGAERPMKIFSILVAALVATQAQAFTPTRPIEVVVHTGPGGGSDLLARAAC